MTRVEAAPKPQVAEGPAADLPRQLTGFVGRRTELNALRKAIKEARLVTLLGPGGIGKTRLAIELARSQTRRWQQGVYWIDLTTVEDSAQVDDAVASALRLPGKRPAIERISASLSQQKALLILDNCEHVLEGGAALCTAILGGCPGVGIIATSRQPLGVPGELRRPVPALADDDALALFEQRGMLVAPDFRLTAANRATVRELCSKVDALPLAIELAASRVGALTEREISAQLERQLGGLLTADRATDRRHRTMTSTIEWSYRLLSPIEARLFCRLAVFHGGFTAESAQSVCEDGRIPQLLETLIALVDKSMVAAERLSDDSTRYRLLELQSVYARERLHESGELDQLEPRHYESFIKTYEARFGSLGEPVPQTYGPGDAEWKRRERANLWAALRWARRNLDDHGLELACLFQRGVALEADQWRLLDWLQEILEELPATGLIASPRHSGVDLREHGVSAVFNLTSRRGDFPRALELARKLLTLVTANAGDGWEERRITALTSVAGALMNMRRLDDAQQVSNEALDLARELGDDSLIADVFGGRGHLALVLGRPEEARELFKQLLDNRESSGSRGAIAGARRFLAAAELACGDLDSAEKHLTGALRWAQAMGGPYLSSDSIELAARLAALRGDDTRALRLAAAKLRSNEILGGDEPYSLDLLVKSIESSRARLGPRKSDEAWKQGLAMDLPRAVDYALENRVDAPPEKRGPLSRREMEVARLVARGMTNREVAEKLFLAERTVEGHLDRIRDKLNVRSRVDVATWALEHGQPENTGSEI